MNSSSALRTVGRIIGDSIERDRGITITNINKLITYSEEEVRQLFIDRAKEFSPSSRVFGDFLLKQDLEWFEQNKKK